jgi:hypothetical protein
LSSDEIGSQSSQGVQSGLNFDLSQEVDVVTLDSIISTVTPVKLIKIDIEGGELFALYGMKMLLMEQKPILVFEWNVKTADAMGYHPDEIIQFLNSLNYDIKINQRRRLINFSKQDYPTNAVMMIWALPVKQTQLK